MNRFPFKEERIFLPYKAFPRADARRYFTVLLAVDYLKDKATIHYIGLLIGCTRSEAQRALGAAALQFGVEFARPDSKRGRLYKIVSWGVLKKIDVVRFIRSARKTLAFRPEMDRAPCVAWQGVGFCE